MWSLTAKLLPDDGEYRSQFGGSLSVYENTMAISSDCSRDKEGTVRCETYTTAHLASVPLHNHLFPIDNIYCACY
jgi:hypothetical protein